MALRTDVIIIHGISGRSVRMDMMAWNKREGGGDRYVDYSWNKW